MVSAGWVRYEPGTGFATLWGGSTLAQWRRRGIYRALVGVPGAVGVERGLHAAAGRRLADSRPILQRLGLVAVTTTTPYVYTP